MSNIFAPWVRPFGTVPLEVGTGPIIGGIKNQHLWFDDQGSIFAVSDGVINHYGDGLPFDINGRLVISGADVVREDQGVPFTFSGAVAMKDPDHAYWDQGLSFTPSGHIASGDIAPPPLTPTWSAIPDQTHFQYELPQTFDVSPYVISQAPILGYSLVTPPAGFTIDGAGVITCAGGTAVAGHLITVRATNISGDGDTTFTWNILLGEVPTWQTIPDRQDRVNTLPQTYDVSSYASSNSGPIVSYALVAPPSGFSIDTSGIITCAAGTAEAAHSINVTATNGVGASLQTSFTWTILEELLVPQWSTIPNQSDREDTLPQTLDVSPYVTTNSGPLTSWSLVTPPTGFSIDSAGVVTCAAGTAVAEHSIVVRVGNDTGFSNSDPFTWDVLEELLVPQWDAVLPDHEFFEADLPFQFSYTPYVSTNAGTLHTVILNDAPAGITIAQTGMVTAAIGTAVGVYPMTITVSNDIGPSTSPTFTWTVKIDPAPPAWQTIPDQSNSEDELPQVLDVSIYASSNASSGLLFAYTLASAPAGFSIDSSGVITCSNPGVGSHQVQARVSNNAGTTNSLFFTWEVTEELLVPQWSTVFNFTTNVLPNTYDQVKNKVTSNAGPLDTWLLAVSPNTGHITIDSNGDIQLAAGTPVDEYFTAVQVSNDVGPASSNTFTITVTSSSSPEFVHDFSRGSPISLGITQFSRASDQQDFDYQDNMKKVGNDIPVIVGGRLSGLDWFEEPGCQGLLLEKESINVVHVSNMDGWESGIANPAIGTKDRVDTRGNANSAWHLEDNNAGWLMHRKSEADETAIVVSDILCYSLHGFKNIGSTSGGFPAVAGYTFGRAGATKYDPFPGNTGISGLGQSVYEGQIRSHPGWWLPWVTMEGQLGVSSRIEVWPAYSLTLADGDKDTAPVGEQIFCDGQIEIARTPSSRIDVPGTTAVVRNRTVADMPVADMGLGSPTLVNDFVVQVVFTLRNSLQHNTDTGKSLRFFEMRGDPGAGLNRLYCYANNSERVRVTFQKDGSSIAVNGVSGQGDFLYGDTLDIRARVSSTQGVATFQNGVKGSEVANTADFTGAGLDTLSLASENGGSSNTSNIVVHLVRVVEGDLTDQEVNDLPGWVEP